MELYQLKNKKYIFNPWGEEDKSSSKNNSKEQRKNDSPPDLEDIFKKFKNKFCKKNNQKYGNNNYKNNNERFLKYSKGFLLFFLLICIFIWIISGFYTIKEAERGVITRFGKFHHLVTPGLNWKPNLIDKLYTVNIETVRELAASGVMLTSDENVVSVEMNVQYRITYPERYLFSAINPDDSLRQATDSALRGVIGRSTMDRILTEGRTIVRTETQRELEDTIKPYEMGINVLDVNFQAARPPEEVKAAFDDAIAARENREQYVREAEAYANEVQPKANGHAQRILEEARAYKARIILEAQGEIARFNKLLPEYHLAPNVTKERLYIETMERILNNTNKVLINNNYMTILPLDKLMNFEKENTTYEKKYDNFFKKNNQINDKQNIIDILNKNNENIMDKRNTNIKRDVEK